MSLNRDMRKWILFCLAAGCLLFQPRAETSRAEETGTLERELLKISATMMEAYQKRDIATIQRTLADDFIGTYDGDVWNKSDLLEAVKKGDDVITSMKNDDVKIRAYGPDTAIMTGQVTAEEKYKGEDISGKHRFTIVFVRQNGAWRVASEHWSRIPEPAK